MADSQPSSDPPPNNAPPPENPILTLLRPTKRQRRPSVRLGDIGDSSAVARHPKLSPLPPSKSRTLTNFSLQTLAFINLRNPNIVGGGVADAGFDSNSNSTPKTNAHPIPSPNKRTSSSAIKRLRSNWASRADDRTHGDAAKSSAEDAGDNDAGNGVCPDRDRDRDGLDREGSQESASKDGTPSQLKDAIVTKRNGTDRVLKGEDGEDLELDEQSDTDGEDWRAGLRMDRRRRLSRRPVDEGVRMWLLGLGLGRYAEVFEIHEVDDEVLPMLTLDDLKEMGINAVGSRRKMYCSIQKLNKGFSLS